jgi:hypothetical protein
MDVMSLSPVLSPREIQRIRTRIAPFQTIHFTSASSEEALFRIAAMTEPLTPDTQIREPSVQTRLVPMCVSTSWQPNFWLPPQAV